MKETLLVDLFYFFSASVLFIPIFRLLGLGSVLGYLFAGIALGPSALGFFHQSAHIQETSEIGVILLLFVIGLELSPARLKSLRKSIVLEGSVQFLVTTFALTGASYYFIQELLPSALIGMTLSLSSTAFALISLRESGNLTKSYGASSFSILLFQDLIIIPILTIIPFLNPETNLSESLSFSLFLKKFLLATSLVLTSRYALNPVLKWIKETQTKEIFFSTTMLLIFGSAIALEHLGLSKALGAFLIGIFLSTTEFKLEIQKVTLPLKSMLMGAFFMGFGLSLDLNYIKEHLLQISAITFAFMFTKTLILTVMGKIKHKSWRQGLSMGLLIGQGGEFGLLILGAAVSINAVSLEINQMLISSITLSLFVSPFLSKAVNWINQQPRQEEKKETENNLLQFPANTSDTEKSDKEAA
ncbi:MAG: cation:proton antiporter [Bacteriovoracaceae bacterium]